MIGTTPSVEYFYADGATGGVAAYVRMTDVIYPNGRDISYSYGTAGGMDGHPLADQYDRQRQRYLCGVSYLGTATIVTENYLEAQVELDYSANDIAAWDRFGRVVDQLRRTTARTRPRWTSTSTRTTGTQRHKPDQRHGRGPERNLYV